MYRNWEYCKSRVRVTAVLFAALVLPATAGLCQAKAEDLITNGDFELDADGDGWPDGWSKQRSVTARREEGNTWLVLDGPSSQNQEIKLDPDWWKLRVSCRMRVTDVVVGDQSWKDARLAMNFVDAARKHLDPWPNVFHATGTSEWKSFERDYLVPRGSRALMISPAMFGPSGRVEFDDIRVTVLKLRSTMKDDAPLPEGVESVWNMDSAWKTGSATRERICLNDLWRFLPVFEKEAGGLPAEKKGWCWIKVPGIWSWRGIRDWRMPEDAQVCVMSGRVEEDIQLKGSQVDQAWYKREIVVPANWAGRRILLDFTMLQTHARVFLDNQPAGESWFPGGRLDITRQVRPGQKQTLAVLVTARPLEAESNVFMAPDRIITRKATVTLKGLTGDVFLIGEPMQNALGDIHVITSTRENRITLDTLVRNAGGKRMVLKARVLDGGRAVKTFQSAAFGAAQLKQGRISFSSAWTNAKLWDTDTPGNMYDVVVTLCDAAGKVLDESPPVRFGFREFWIDGRDFYLNGKRIHLRALHTRNISAGADMSSLDSSLNTCRKIKEYGFNFFITGNYSFSPGQVGYMDGLFQAADETGVLASFSLPHVKDFAWKLNTPQQAQRYRSLTDWLIRRAQNHPSIVLYAMNHNATGYYGDQNPVRIDGIFSPEDPGYEGARTNPRREQSQLAAGIAKEFDPTRPVYHHQSGNLGDMHTVNIYLNWAPKQERSDWLEHWATAGVKPLFFVEWGLPHISSWSSYRGPKFIWRNEAFQQIWDSEYAAAFIGQDAYRMTESKRKSMAHEEKLWAKGEPFYWSRLIQYLRSAEENHFRIKALFCDDNWRAHRTWGISAMLPWDQGDLWKYVTGYDPKPQKVKDNYGKLQQPGIVPDYIAPASQAIYCMDAGAMEPTSLGRSFLRWNTPLTAYIGGGPERFTEKGHNFTAGETVRKQLVILNDTRRDTTCSYSWTLTPGGREGRGTVTVKAGDKVFVPVAVRVSGRAKPGRYTISARFDFDTGETQQDSFALDIMPRKENRAVFSRIALFDPKGMTARALDGLGIRYRRVGAASDLRDTDILVIGREAMTADGRIPDISRVVNGLKVLVFEQREDVLTERLGFRTNVHGMREAFGRTAGHPALEGIGDSNLRDWRGAATLVPPYLDIKDVETFNPRWGWCGFFNTRVWKCGNHGCVASVLIEKPPRGNFLPIVDCAFDLQYSPLLEYSEGRGRIIFCQLDVTGRTETDPAAREICFNLLHYLGTVKPAPSRKTFYAGGEQGSELLKSMGVEFQKYTRQRLYGNMLLVVSPGAGRLPQVSSALDNGVNVLCLGLDGAELDKVLPGQVKVSRRPTVPSLVERFDGPELAGISNAELHWRTLLELPALEQTSTRSNEALRVLTRGRGRAVLCQAAPWMFDYSKKPYLRTTYRRNLFLVSRLLHNLGAPSRCPLIARFRQPAAIYDHPLPQSWKGMVDKNQVGRDQGWFKPELDDSRWQPIAVPGAFDRQIPELAGYNGVFWYRIRFRLPENMSSDELTLFVGGVDDESWTWLNGKFLGEVTRKTNPKDHWSFPREYEMGPGMLNREGENVLVVRCNDTYQTGGITGVPRLTAPGPWLKSFYVQTPKSVDDPYRYYRW